MKKKLEYLVIHCTATPEGREVTSAEIRRWHTDPKPQGNGWHQVGYSKLFHINGGVEILVENNSDEWVDEWEITNGVAGRNSICQHWCYIGGMTEDMTKPKDTRSWMQKEALKREVLAFHRQFPMVKIVGHHHFDTGRACPSFDVQAWLKTIGINQTI